MTSTSSIKIMSCVLIFLVFACKGKKEKYHNLIDKIEAKSVEYKRNSIQEQNLFEPDALVLIDENNIQFHIQSRTFGSSSSSCSFSIRLAKGFTRAIIFDYEDEHDDEDDLNTLRMASQGGRPHFDFAIY